MDKDMILMTPASLLDLLSQISELSEYNLGVTETLDGNLQLTVGDSVYEFGGEDATDIQVDEYTAAQVDNANEDAYESLDQEPEFDISHEEVIESGIIKELAKTLLVGGLVRMGVNTLGK